MDYKNETFKIKNFIENFNNLFSVGAGGEFNYADSQILFHKSFDLEIILIVNLTIFQMKEKIFLGLTLKNLLKLETKKSEKTIQHFL